MPPAPIHPQADSAIDNAAPRRRRRWRWRRWVVAGLLAPLAVVAGLNAWVLAGAHERIHTPTSAAVTRVPVALVLGTSPRRSNGSPNLHFQRRLDAAAALFASGKAAQLLVSGATDGGYYNEPRDMRTGLIARGVPEAAILMDVTGVRTFDSVVQLKEDFHAGKCAIVSDGWHVPRALFIADRIGLEAVGVSAEPVPLRQSMKSRSRECLARVLVVLDLYVLGTRPEADGPRW